LLPIMAIVRARNNRCPPSPSDELRATKADGALERVLDLERALIVRGSDLPVGGSLLLIANRT
jgi:hypothetical protein